MLGRLFHAWRLRRLPAQALLAQGIRSAEAGDQQGGQDCAAQLQAVGRPASAAYVRALLAQGRGDAEAALSFAMQAVHDGPAEPVYWLKTAELHFALGRPAESASWYERLLGVPGFAQEAQIWFAAAGAWERSGQAQRAIDSLQQALALSPGFDEARVNLALLQALR